MLAVNQGGTADSYYSSLTYFCQGRFLLNQRKEYDFNMIQPELNVIKELHQQNEFKTVPVSMEILSDTQNFYGSSDIR